MDSRYKIIVYNKNLYREVEISSDTENVKIGTTSECDYRLRKDSFFESIEVTFTKKNNNWSVACSDNLYITVGDVRKLLTKSLTHGEQFDIKYQDSDNIVFSMEFLIDFDSGKREYNRVVDLTNVNKFSIGFSDNMNIVLKSPYIQKDHIEIINGGNKLNIKITETTYGVYHNGIRVNDSTEVLNGDFISIADFYFYYKSGKLYTENRKDIITNGLNCYDMPDMNNYPKFNRNTRIKTVINNEEIEILDPPSIPQKPKNNLLTRLLPTMGMLLSAGIMAAYGGRMIIMSAISGVMAIITTILGIKEGKKDYEANVADREEKYRAYIENKKETIESYRQEEKTALEEMYISQEIAQERIEHFSEELFDRTPKDEDFLNVYLGIGAVEANRKINYKKQEKLEPGDELQMIPEKLSEEYKYIEGSPIVCNFRDINAIGVVGNENNRYELLKNIIVDIITRQYHTDVNMAFIATEDHKNKMRWLRWLPHVYREEFGGRLLVCDDDSKKNVFEYLYKEFTNRANNKKFDNYIIVFFYDEYEFKSHPISKFVDKAKELGIIFVFFGDSRKDIPQGCSYLIDVKNSKEAELIDTKDKNSAESFVFTNISDEKMEHLISLVAPVYTEEISLESSLTKNITLFELLNIISVDDIDLKKRWETSQVYKSMTAPIGVSKSRVVSLDLHDKFHGPHGLVAGTTGSGKSEILQTYILSMATLYHPYEVGFVIIDFKGGGMVNQFRDLPHLVGAITNIDGKEINRSLKSIKAELRKRQQLFAEADVNHIDKYIRKYKGNEVTTPLPHLIIIVDEFAELKAEQPEFMKELISAARIGRSLGVHLILATQKPSGQVNEQIWSNSKFKLCLKVQSQEDSNEVIKSPLAAEIKEPGRAYLQVGNNEIFELFQSAYSGAPEKVDDNNKKEFSIFNITDSGKRIPIFTQKNKNDSTGITQLDSIVKYISEYCKKIEFTKLPDICLPPLKDIIKYPGKFEKSSMTKVPLGIYDAPDLQYQGEAAFNLSETNTLIVGSTSTGKTNLLQNIIRFYASNYSPTAASFYIMDFGAMYLKNFESLNHVGGVVTISEDEKLKNLFKLITEEINTRKEKFMQKGLSSFSSYVEAGYSDMPQMFLMIDNFSAFKEIYADSYEDTLLYILREGLSCGISVIITNMSTSGLGYKYMSNLGNRFVFTCNDNNEYSNLFNHCRMQPSNLPGRALCEIDKEVYEMQTFIAFEGEREIDRSKAVKEYVDEINNKYYGVKAKQIPSVPETLTKEYIENNYDLSLKPYQYPIAIDYSSVDIVTFDMRAMNEFCIIGKETSRKLAATNSILDSIHYNIFENPVKMYIIDSLERPLKNKSDLSYVEKYTVDSTEISAILDDIMPELEERQELLLNGEMERLQRSRHIIVLINNRDVAEYISSSKSLLETYTKATRKMKSVGITFLFADIEDAATGYNSPELLKRFKDYRKALIASKLSEFKFCDLPAATVRNFKSAKSNDFFLMDGQDIQRIKIVEG